MDKKGIKCPYCSSTETEEIGEGVCVCWSCKKKFDTPKKKTCPKCGSEEIEEVSTGKYACWSCRNVFTESGEDFSADKKPENKRKRKKEKENSLLTVKCENCGSSDVEVVCDEYGTCKNCGSKIMFPKKDVTNISKSTLNIYSNKSVINAEDYSNVYAAKRIKTKEEFLREA